MLEADGMGAGLHLRVCRDRRRPGGMNWRSVGWRGPRNSSASRVPTSFGKVGMRVDEVPERIRRRSSCVSGRSVNDVAFRSEPVRLQRAFGELAVSLKQRGKCSVLDELRQVGCLKARFPRPDDAAWLHVVTLNTSGGVAGGDVLDTAIAVGAEARATIASQAAERFYRALPGSAASSVRTRIAVADGRRGRVAAAGDHPVRSLRRAPPSARRTCRGRVVSRRGKSGVRPCRDGRGGANGHRCATSSRCGEAGDCCCTMRSAWRGRWRRRCSGPRSRMVRVRWRRSCMSRPTPRPRWTRCVRRHQQMRCQRLGWHVDRAYACGRRCVAACRGDRRVGGVARRAAAAARMAVLRGNG